MAKTQEHALQDLSEILGPKGLIVDAEACARAGTDWRGHYAGPVLALACPATTGQAAAVVRWASAHDVPLVPQGGNSSLAGGAVPVAEGPPSLILSTRRLNAIRHIGAGEAVVEAGVVLETLACAVAPLQVPVDLGARGLAQIGGLLSSHAGGLNVVRYGSLRAQVLGLEAVMPDGNIWHGLSQVVKDNTGLDLKSLLIGAEGTLGLITAARLRLHPAPAARLTLLCACANPAEALAVYQALLPSFDGHIMAAELMPQLGMARGLAVNSALRNPFGADLPDWALLLEIGLRPGLVQAEEALALDLLAHTGALLAQSQGQRADFWALREGMQVAQGRFGASIKHDVCLPLSAVDTFLDQGAALAQSLVPGCLPVPFGHLGDGSFHFNISRPADGDDAAFIAQTGLLNHAIHDLVSRLGGSISAEHGLGQYRQAEAARLRDPVATQTMAAIKAALDPKGRFNPGKFYSEP